MLASKLSWQSLKRNSASGFTIIELIVVILVISILSTIVSISYGSYLHDTGETQVKTDLISAASKLKTAAVDSGVYPSSGSKADLVAAGFEGSSDVTITPIVVTAPDTSFCLSGTSNKYSDITFYITATAAEPSTTVCP